MTSGIFSKRENPLSNWGPVESLIDRIILDEGGIKDVGDGKGVTRWGQTPSWLKTWNLPTPNSVPEAKENYRLWLVRTGLIHLCATADLLAWVTIDWAIHSGHATAVHALQKLVKTDTDGVYGSMTKRAVDEVSIKRRKELAAYMISERVKFLGRITRDTATNIRYISGWLNRVSKHIEQLGLLP